MMRIPRLQANLPQNIAEPDFLPPTAHAAENAPEVIQADAPDLPAGSTGMRLVSEGDLAKIRFMRRTAVYCTAATGASIATAGMVAGVATAWGLTGFGPAAGMAGLACHQKATVGIGSAVLILGASTAGCLTVGKAYETNIVGRQLEARLAASVTLAPQQMTMIREEPPIVTVVIQPDEHLNIGTPPDQSEMAGGSSSAQSSTAQA